nr:DUF302 domain-containing protein [Nocardia sp. BMG51109]
MARLDAPFDVVVARTREALRRQGFGVLSEIDVRAVLRDKAGEPIEDYLILGACHPRLACDALNADRRAGLLLPCNVIVRAAGAGTLVEAVDPEVLSGVLPHPDLERVAAEARRLLTDALAELSGAPR